MFDKYAVFRLYLAVYSVSDLIKWVKKIMKLSFFWSKKFYIPVIILVLVGFFGYRQYSAKHQPPTYETVAAERGSVIQTVEATGKLEAVDDLALRFETPGLLAKVNVVEGAMVTSGTILANLRLSELNASVAQAVANLNQRLAGPTVEDKKYYESAVQSSKASLDQAKLDATNQVADAEAAVLTAQNNLRLASGGNDSQIVTQAYESAVSVLQATLPKLDDALTQADNVLGVDNTTGGAAYQPYISVSNPSVLNDARFSYIAAKNERTIARAALSSLTQSSSKESIDAGLVEADKALSLMNTLLAKVSTALSGSFPGGALTQSVLDGLKNSVQVSRTSITTQISTVLSAKQAIENAKNSLTTYKIAYDKAVRALDQTKANVVSVIQIRQAAYDQAVASLASKVNPPRSVDVASYRAQVAQAVAARDKAYLRAPIDGQITKINKKPGELVSGADVVMNLLSPHYEIQVDIAEVDVPKIKIGDKVVITLDAFGPDTKFNGEVAVIDPASTLIQDVVYYKVRIRLDDTKQSVKPGMTANVSVATAQKENTLFVPARTIRTRDDGSRYVRVLVGGVNEEERDVKLGLRGNEGKTEILSGVSEGEKIIVSKKEAGA